VLIAALLVAAGAVLAGPSTPARTLRSAVRSTAERVPGWLAALSRRGRATFTRTG
jgi:hypothetical protein